MPEAKNNLGVIRHTQGKEAEARRLFEEARTADTSLAEAAYNLGEEARSSRLDRATKYGLEGPFYAVPTFEIWSEALVGPFNLETFFDSFGFVEQLSITEQAPAEEPAVMYASVLESSILALVYLLFAILAVHGMFYKLPMNSSTGRSKTSVVGWSLGLAVPGTARQLSFLGLPILALSIHSALSHYFLATSSGIASNLIDAIAIPNLNRGYGIGEILHSPLETAIRQTSSFWWILWIANLLVVLALERIFPDPLGPRGQASVMAPELSSSEQESSAREDH